MFRQFEGLKALVIDDNEDNQLLISKILRLEGMNVALADNGFDGVAQALQDHFDIVLMDIQMPAMDGYGAVSELRAKNFEKPVIALTAHGLRGERERCLSAGFTDYIPKPLSRENLITRVREALNTAAY